MMTEVKDKKSPGYMSGFMIGAALGAVAMFFMGTKKGRKLAKHMHAKGGKTVKDLAVSHIQRLQTKGRQAAAKYFPAKPTKKS